MTKDWLEAHIGKTIIILWDHNEISHIVKESDIDYLLSLTKRGYSIKEDTAGSSHS